MARRWSITERHPVAAAHDQLAQDVRLGLAGSPPSLPSRWFYDEKGSLLFDDITTLPEYYPTRRETEALSACAADVAARTAASTLVELGSGTSAKTRLLLDALTDGRRDLLFVPVDVSVEVLTQAARAIAADYPSVTVHAMAADFAQPVDPLPGRPGGRLLAFLGGTIGNLDTASRRRFLARWRTALDRDDHFLLGADLVKDVDRMVAAYDDEAGVTAEFNRNIIAVVSRELAAEGLAPEDFEHVARWDSTQTRIEMWLRARRDVHAVFPTLDLVWDLPAGGELLTEISVKFDLPVLHDELRANGFDPVHSWTDGDGDFSLTLSRVP